MVFKVDAQTLVKVVAHQEDFTEYTTLQYLEKHRPSIPAPKPLGVVSLGRFSLIFMSYLPAMTLGAAWTHLSQAQKSSIQSQLDEIFTDLRSLACPEAQLLGGGGSRRLQRSQTQRPEERRARHKLPGL